MDDCTMSVKTAEQALLIKMALQEHKNDLNFARIAGFASAEHLAHTIPYDLSANFDPTVPLLAVDDDGALREYTVTHIETKNPAIVGYILAGKDNNPRVHIVFRGTADKASMIRDLEYGGAGQKSFYAEKDLILSQIDAVIRQRANEWTNQEELKIKLSISGHSLGGGDAQNCFAAISDVMSRLHGHKRFKERMLDRINGMKNALVSRTAEPVATSIHAPLTLIDSITVNHVNSAGVTHATAERCSKSAKYLAKSGVKIHVRALRVAADGIQQTGQTNILSDIDPAIAKVEVLKVKSNDEGWLSPKSVVAAAGAAYFSSPLIIAGALGSLTAYGTVKSHTATHFNKVVVQDQFLHFDNATPEGATAIKHKLSHSSKSIVDNNPISHSLKKIAHAFSSVFVSKRKVSPQVLNQYEEFKKHISEHSHHDDESLEALFHEEVLETTRNVLTFN